MSISWRGTSWLCIAAVAAACTTPLGMSTGLTGIVTRGPITPVCQVDVPCEAPFAATFEVRQFGRRVASFTSDDAGRFTVRLVPGSYTIIPGANAPIIDAPSQVKTVQVEPDGLTSVSLSFDTGLR